MINVFRHVLKRKVTFLCVQTQVKENCFGEQVKPEEVCLGEQVWLEEERCFSVLVQFEEEGCFGE